MSFNPWICENWRMPSSWLPCSKTGSAVRIAVGGHLLAHVRLIQEPGRVSHALGIVVDLGIWYISGGGGHLSGFEAGTCAVCFVQSFKDDETLRASLWHSFVHVNILMASWNPPSTSTRKTNFDRFLLKTGIWSELAAVLPQDVFAGCQWRHGVHNAKSGKHQYFLCFFCPSKELWMHL